jgi:hypothetical protein
LDTDLALLTAREIRSFLDPEIVAYELLLRRRPIMHFADPEGSIPDPRTDPTLTQLLRAWAELGQIESEAARADSVNPLRPAESAALKRIGKMAVTVEEGYANDDGCRTDGSALRLAATDRLRGARITVASGDLVTPELSINVTALPIGADGCAAFVSLTLRDVPYVAPGYRPAPPVISRKLLVDGRFVASPRSGFRERVAAQVRQSVEVVASRITR